LELVLEPHIAWRSFTGAFLLLVVVTAAGTLLLVVLGKLLRILHGMGLVCGMVSLALLALAPAWNIYKPRTVLAPMTLIVLMIALTAYSQWGIIPAMERDRIAAGGAIDTRDSANPLTAHFNSLHNRSEDVEGAVLLLGLATVVLVAKAETSRA